MTLIETTNGHVNGTTNGHDNGTTGRTSNKPKQRSQLQPSIEVAISPNDPSKIPSTIKSIQSLGNSFSATDDGVRRQLLAEARQLVQALETPRETMIKHCWAQVSDHCIQQTRTEKAYPFSLPHTWPSRSVSISDSSAPCKKTTLPRRKSKILQKLSTRIRLSWVSNPR